MRFPANSLRAPRTKFDPYGTSSITFFDRLKDGSLQIAAIEEKRNRPAAGWKNAFTLRQGCVERPQPQQSRIPAGVNSRNGGRARRATSFKTQLAETRTVVSTSYAREPIDLPRKGENSCRK